MPKAPVEHGIPIAAFMPVIYQNEELFKLRNTLVDNYASFYKNLNVLRDEMFYVMMATTSTDPLTGTQRLDYMK